MGELIMDGELSAHVVNKLEHSIEEQTRVRPISIFRHRQYVTAGDLARLILCWRIIHRRIFVEQQRIGDPVIFHFHYRKGRHFRREFSCFSDIR